MGKKVPNKANKVVCNFCKIEYGGGITHFKEYFAHVSGNGRACHVVSVDVMQKALNMLNKLKRVKEGKDEELRHLLSEVHVGEDEDDEVTRRIINSNIHKSRQGKGPMDQFVATQTSEEVVSNTRQSIIQSVLPKKERDDAVKYLAEFFYEASLESNVPSLPSFIQMVFTIGMFGQTLQPPTSYELSETFLQREVTETNTTLNTFKDTCAIG